MGKIKDNLIEQFGEEEGNIYYNLFKEKQNLYNKTKTGRACYLINRYNQSDKTYNRGKGDLDSDWFVNHIFNHGKCIYCGNDNWQELGVDRIDNSKPHSKDNVVCCCSKCNRERNRKPFATFFREKLLSLQ